VIPVAFMGQLFLRVNKIMNNSYAVLVKKIIAEQKDYLDHYIVIEAGKISAITNTLKSDIPVINLAEMTLVPGLIDLHIHGRKGCDVMDASVESMNTISNSLATHGVTGFLATTVTSSWQETLAAMKVVGETAKQLMPGAQVLGAYSEGLFFTNKHKGAHNEEFFLPLTRERVEQLIFASQQELKVLALAPEIDNSQEMIKYLKNRGVKVMLGHTDATYQQTVDALDAGACGGVHVFNGMRGIHHREPGCTGAVLVHDTNVEVIADGVHLHPAILQMICQLKKNEQITLISDCVNAGGLTDGQYQLGKMAIQVNDGIARTKSGSLAGSTLTLEKAVQNMCSMTNVAFRDAVHMASLSPAIFLGISDHTGSITIGKHADLTILDASGAVQMTFVRGKAVYISNNLAISDDAKSLLRNISKENE